MSRRFNLELLILGLVLLAAGAHILITGKIRILTLGDERYLVGGLAGFVGATVLWAARRRSSSKHHLRTK